MTPTRPGDDLDLLTHHGDVEAVGMTDFAVNVAVAAPPAFVADAVRAAVDDVAAYPDPTAATQALAEHLGIPADRLLLTNGAAEAFHLLARSRPWRAPVIVHPQFTEPDTALRAAGLTPAWHVLPEPAFTLDAAEVARLDREHPGADLVMVGNPTNPTSRLHAAADLLSLRAPERLLVVDEAFMDVVPREQDTLLRHAAAGEGVAVVRSLTKTFGLAGLRAGFVVSDPQTIRDLARRQPHWSVNHLALAAVRAVATPAGVAHTRDVGERVARDRAHLVDGLERLGLQVVGPAAAPFVLVHTPGAAHLRIRLREAGIALRRGDTFPGLGEDWLRIAVRDRTTTDELLAALARHIQPIRPHLQAGAS